VQTEEIENDYVQKNIEAQSYEDPVEVVEEWERWWFFGSFLENNIEWNNEEIITGKTEFETEYEDDIDWNDYKGDFEDETEWEEEVIQRIPSQIQKTVSNVPGLSSFPQIQKTWGNNLNPGGDIPQTWFKSVYFNTETQEVWKTEIQESIYVYEVWGNDIYDLGVYFTGQIEILEDGVYEFVTSESWSSTRAILDGRDVSSRLRSAEKTIALTAGTYTLEVEFINDWHVADFAFALQNYKTKYTFTWVARELQSLDRNNFDIWFAWVYESWNANNDITLEIPRYNRPIVLMLNSYDSVNWLIENPFNTQIEAIIYSSYTSWVNIEGAIWQAKLFQTSDSFPIMYSILPSCSDFWGRFHCEGDIEEFFELHSIANSIFQKDLWAFVWAYSPKILSLPWDVLTPARYSEIQQDIQDLRDKEREVQNPKSFDDIF